MRSRKENYMIVDRINRKHLLPTAAIAIVALLNLAGCSKGKEGTDTVTSEKVKVEFYVMSQCPYGKQVEDGIAPVLKKLGANIDFRLDFIGKQRGGKLTSMHGENEVNGDKIQLCAVKHAPNNYMDMISCMNKNMRAIPNGWEACAKEAGLKVDQLKTCYEGQEGTDLLKASFSRAAKRGARGSPTIYIADQPYKGKRSERDFTRAICSAFTKDGPKLCDNFPKPPPQAKVPITILSDKRCRECSAPMWKHRFTGLFPTAEIKILYYSSDEGRKLYADLGLEKLPAIIMGKEVEKTHGYARVKRRLRPVGDYLSYRVGAKFDPTKEICDNGKDDTNNGIVDCADSDCADALVCRKEIAKKLDVFVMSHCPHGVRALDVMKEVLENFGNEINFEVHFIASAKGDGFESLHKQPEVDENIRELCAIKHYRKNYKYMDYVLCRNKNIRSTDWQSCTGKNKINTKVMEKCINGEEGKSLLRKDIQFAQELGITASPTWVANNRFKFSGDNAETVRRNMCQHNKGLKNCDKKLSGPQIRRGRGGCDCGGGGSCK
jgi:glutaredoxin